MSFLVDNIFYKIKWYSKLRNTINRSIFRNTIKFIVFNIN